MENTQNDAVMDINDLMTLDLDGVEAKYEVRTQPGKYLVTVAEAELDTVDTDKDGVIPVVKLQFEIQQCVGLDKETDEEGNDIDISIFAGTRIYDTFWLRDQNDVGKLVGFLTSYNGVKPSGSLNDSLSTLKNDDVYAIMRVNHRKNKDNPAQPYINVSHDKKEIVGHAALVEQGVVGG